MTTRSDHVFAGRSSAPEQPAALGSPEAEARWRAAIGPRADFYLGRWRRMDEKNSAVSWNWAACLANLFWFAFRKMWLPMGVLIAAFIGLAIVGAAAPQVALLLNIAITFVTGAFGNHLYRRHLGRLVAATEPLGRDAQLAALRERGGTSTPALVGSLVIVGLFMLLLVIAAIGSASQP